MDFSLTYERPNRYRHEHTARARFTSPDGKVVTRDVVHGLITGSNGQQAYTYNRLAKTYTVTPANPQYLLFHRIGTSLFPCAPPPRARLQIPGMRAKPPIFSVEKQPDESIDGHDYRVIRIGGEDHSELTLWIDPRTHLVRRQVRTSQYKGHPKQTMSADYIIDSIDRPLAPHELDWSAPGDARTNEQALLDASTDWPITWIACADSYCSCELARWHQSAAGGRPPVYIAADAQLLLDCMQAAYDRLESLEIEGTDTKTIHLVPNLMPQFFDFRAWYRAPDRLYIESGNLTMLSQGKIVENPYSAASASIVARNGREAHTQRLGGTLKRRLRETIEPGRQARLSAFAEVEPGRYIPPHPVLPDREAGFHLPIMLAAFTDGVAAMVAPLAEVALLPDADIDGTPCHALALKPPHGGPITLYIDRATLMIRRIVRLPHERNSSGMALTIDYRVTRCNVPIPDQRFELTPSPDSRDVSPPRPTPRPHGTRMASEWPPSRPS